MKTSFAIFMIVCLIAFSMTFTGKSGYTNQIESPLPDLSLPEVKYKPEFKGSEPYTPTKSEWLTVWLNSKCIGDYRDFGFSLSFFTNAKDKIGILVVHSDTAKKSQIDDVVKLAQEWIDFESSRYGWDSWVKTEVRYSLSQH